MSHLATKMDKAYNIDKWARLFKAQTWEEIKMLAEKNPSITEAAATIYQISEDERIRQQCEAREDYLRRQRGIQRKLEKLDNLEKALAEKDNQLVEKDKELAENRKELAEKDNQLAEKDKLIEELRRQIKKQNDRE